MLTTLDTEILENYAPILSQGSQLHSFVTLQPGTVYFLLNYTCGGRTGGETAVLMWRMHEVIELFTYVRQKQGRILDFSLLDCSETSNSRRVTCREVTEFWVSWTKERANYSCHLLTADGGSRMFHGSVPSSESYEQMERLY